jgi:hypothetical protein
MLEGAPFQGERYAFTAKFNRLPSLGGCGVNGSKNGTPFPFPCSDFPLYGRVGLTLKF